MYRKPESLFPVAPSCEMHNAPREDRPAEDAVKEARRHECRRGRLKARATLRSPARLALTYDGLRRQWHLGDQLLLQNQAALPPSYLAFSFAVKARFISIAG